MSILQFVFISLPLLLILPSFAVREECYAALDVVQIQDMTSSFDFVWGTMAVQAEEVMELISKTHQESLYGFATFGDKPIKTRTGSQLGYSSDYCLRVDVPLKRPDAQAVATLFNNYSKRAMGGGGDWQENVLGGLYRALISHKIRWRTASVNGTKVARVAVLVTDAFPHLEGDVVKLTDKKVRPFGGFVFRVK